MKNDTIVIKTIAGGPVRLDYVSMAWKSPKPAPRLSGNLPVAQYVHNITNQDHHADALADMVIIIPTSQKLLRQAQRLKAWCLLTNCIMNFPVELLMQVLIVAI